MPASILKVAAPFDLWADDTPTCPVEVHDSGFRQGVRYAGTRADSLSDVSAG
jgi:hypothetical protein